MIKLLKIMMLETPRLFSLAHFKASILVRERERGRERDKRERGREGETERDEMFVCVSMFTILLQISTDKTIKSKSNGNYRC